MGAIAALITTLSDVHLFPGANYESNVIFSPSSYIPRTATLNLTVDIFGESINLLEVCRLLNVRRSSLISAAFQLYGRLQGFEHYLESIFGPDGPLSAKNVQEKIPKLRWARHAGLQEMIKSKVESFKGVLDNKFGEPKVSLGLKVFGNELKYASYDGDDQIKAALASLNPIDHLTRLLSGKVGS